MKMEILQLDYSELDSAEFWNCNLIPANFKYANLNAVTFKGSYLPYAVHFENANLVNTDFEGAYVPGQNWLEEMESSFKNYSFSKKYKLSEKSSNSMAKNVNQPIYFYKVLKNKENQ